MTAIEAKIAQLQNRIRKTENRGYGTNGVIRKLKRGIRQLQK